jgi:precorrin-4 methylase
MRKINLIAAVFILMFACLAGPALSEGPGKLYVVGMGPAGPDLTAPRALDVVKTADVLLCSPGMPGKFKMFGAWIDPTKVAFNPWENIIGKGARELKKSDPAAWRSAREKQKRKVQDFVRRQIAEGKTVVMMDGGDPCVYGPSLHYLLEGFGDAQFEVIAGMGAFNAAGAALKRTLTPGETRFVMLTSHASMFGDNWEKRDDILKDLSKYDMTMVWYMSLRSIDRVVTRMKRYFPADLPVAVVYYAGYPEKERVLKSSLATILADVRKMDEKWLGLFIAGQCAQ